MTSQIHSEFNWPLATSLFELRCHEIFLRQSFFFKLVPCFEKESSISNMLARKHDRKPEEILKFISCQEFTSTLILSMYVLWQYGLWSFQTGVIKLERFLPKNQHTQTLIFASYWGSPLVQFSKFQNFLSVCWFLGQSLSNSMYPVWKLHNPYCHNVERWFFKAIFHGLSSVVDLV